MDHCRNAREPETAATRSVEAPEPRELAVQFDETGVEPGDGEVPEGRRALDAWADELRQSHLEQALAHLEKTTELDDEQRAAIAACSRRLVDELLGGPRKRMVTDEETTVDEFLKLFDLDPE